MLLSAAAGWVMVMSRVVVQLFASVTVQVHVPGARLAAELPVCTGDVFQLNA